jgi:hypothetical protein
MVAVDGRVLIEADLDTGGAEATVTAANPAAIKFDFLNQRF